MELNSLYIRDFHIHFSYTSASILTNNFRIFIFRYYVLGVIRSSRNNGFSGYSRIIMGLLHTDSNLIE